MKDIFKIAMGIVAGAIVLGILYLVVVLAVAFMMGTPATDVSVETAISAEKSAISQERQVRTKREKYLDNRAQHGLLDAVEMAELKELKSQDTADSLAP